MTEIKQCGLFYGLAEEELKRALDFFKAREVTYARGGILHFPGDRLPFFGLVKKGSVEVSVDDYDGRHIIMAVVEPGGVFGESLCFLGKPTEVLIEAKEDTVLLLMSAERLSQPLKEEWEYELSHRFTAMLARRTLEMNNRIQILSMPTLRKKILLYLSFTATKTGEKKLLLPMDRAAMAAYLGSDRSALSRELSAMQRDGLIRFSQNRFELL